MKKTVGRHFHIWDTGSSSDMLDERHLYHLEIEPIIGSDMLVWQSDSLYYGRNGQVLSLEKLRKEIPPELVGSLNLMLAAKQNKNKRGKKTQALVHETTIDAEIPTERDRKIIPFRPAA